MADPKYNPGSALYMSHLKKILQRTDARLDAVEAASTAAFKSLKVDGHTVKFFTSDDQTRTPAATLDFPTEMFLDQLKTRFVDNFAWSAAAYPGSTNPSHDDINLEGKPVFVLAVRGDADGDDNPDNDTVTYSFIDMSKLVDTYKAKTEGKDGSTTITISGYEVEVVVNISSKAGNRLTTDEDGKLYVGPETVGSDKEDEILTADANGNMQASGKKVGGATLANTPTADTVATEAAVKAAIDGQATAVASENGEGGAKGLMSQQDKEKLDGIVFATDAEVEAMLDEVYGPVSSGE